jgi:Holliday junction DNA helicase RuvA
VGYLVQVSNRTRQALPPRGEAATLLIETQMREDAVTLFGFIDREERDWFRTLTTVQGVGGKVALNILSILAPGQLVLAIVAQDKAQLARADGVWPRLAARLVTELKDKATVSSLSVPASAPPAKPSSAKGKAAAAEPAPPKVPPTEEAISALVNLGYRRAEAMVAVMTAARQANEDATLSDLIRGGLKELGT